MDKIFEHIIYIVHVIKRFCEDAPPAVYRIVQYPWKRNRRPPPPNVLRPDDQFFLTACPWYSPSGPPFYYTCGVFDEPSNVAPDPAFSLEHIGGGTAQEQLLSGVLESLGVSDWEITRGVLGASEDLPHIDLTHLIPLIIFILSVLTLWLFVKELLPSSSEVQRVRLESTIVPHVKQRSLMQLAFGNIDDLRCGLDTLPVLDGAPSGLKASSEVLEAELSSGEIGSGCAALPSGDTTVDLAPMTFVDPTTFAAGDPDSPALNASTGSFDALDSVVINGPGSGDSNFPTLAAPTSVASSGSVDGSGVPTTVPSFDVLGPLLAAPSDLAVSLMDENLEESLSDEVLQSAGLITPADSVAEVSVGKPVLGSVAPQSSPMVVQNAAISSTRASFRLPLAANLDICARLPVVEPENDDSDFKTHTPSAPAEPCGHEGVGTAQACSQEIVGQKPSADASDCIPGSLQAAAELPASSSGVSGVGLPEYMPSDWSQVTPSSNLSERLGEAVTARDWTTIKCYMSLQEDQAKRSGSKRITLVQEHPLPIHFPDPHPIAPYNTVESFPEVDDVFCSHSHSIPQAKPSFYNEHRRALSEPPAFSDREWIRSEVVEPTPKLSATKARLDIFKDPRCPVLPAEVDERFPLKSPELQGHFSSIAAQMGFIMHNRSHLRFQPPALIDAVVSGEQLALKLAVVPELRRRHSIGGFRLSKYGMTKSAFLRPYLPYLREQLTYAEVTGAGITPWGRVVTMSSDDKGSPGNRLDRAKFLDVNRSRSGQDISHNGVGLKAEYIRPLLPLRRDPTHPSAATPPRSRIAAGDSQSSSPCDSPDRPRRPRSLTTAVPHDLRRANSFQFNAYISSPESTERVRARTETSSPATPDRAKRARFAEPLFQPATPSGLSPSPSGSVRPQSILARRSSASPLPRLSIVGRPRSLDTIVGSPTKGSPTTAVTAVHSCIASAPSMDAMAAIVGDAKARAYPRIDDDRALEQFETELGVVGSSGM